MPLKRKNGADALLMSKVPPELTELPEDAYQLSFLLGFTTLKIRNSTPESMNSRSFLLFPNQGRCHVR